MAVTIQNYNHTKKLLLGQEVTLATLKVVLLNGSAVFDATDVTTSEVTSAGANEVSGNGWDAGGELIAGVAASVVSTNDAKIDATDLSVTAVGGAIGPAEGAVIVDATSGKPLSFINFGGVQSAGEGTPFLFAWNAAGILTAVDSGE